MDEIKFITGQISFDTESCRFTIGGYQLHCGDCFELEEHLPARVWTECCIELNGEDGQFSGWYFIVYRDDGSRSTCRARSCLGRTARVRRGWCY